VGPAAAAAAVDLDDGESLTPGAGLFDDDEPAEFTRDDGVDGFFDWALPTPDNKTTYSSISI
jgi:hypothetical protein